jgi:UDP-glucose 4-epimerase
LLQAIVEIFEFNDAIVKSIGIRHGEKVYESLLSTEERVSSEDLGDFFRVPLDTRTLDYSVYFEDGDQRPADIDSYTSHNTTRLNVSEVKELLLQLPEIQTELK